MFYQYLQSDAEQNDAANQFDIQLKAFAKRYADDTTRKRKQKTTQCDDADSGINQVAQRYKNQPCGQRIDAGGYRHQQKHLERSEWRASIVVCIATKAL